MSIGRHRLCVVGCVLLSTVWFVQLYAQSHEVDVTIRPAKSFRVNGSPGFNLFGPADNLQFEVTFGSVLNLVEK